MSLDLPCSHGVEATVTAHFHTSCEEERRNVNFTLHISTWRRRKNRQDLGRPWSPPPPSN